MNEPLIMTGEDSTQLCKWVMNLFAPRRVLIVSGRLTSLVQEFLRNGIPAVELIPAQRNSQSLEAKEINDSTREMESEPFDLVLAGEDALNGINDFLSAGYLGKLGPGVSILVIFSLTPGRFLAPAAGRMLANVGFSRDLRIEKSIADRLLVYSYSLSALDTGQVIENYESALWRMTQQSQKRRLLLADFRQDIYREISAAQQYKQMVQNSRTGKAIQALQKVRRKIFPAGSLQARLAGWVLLALHLVRSEGAFGFLKQAPRRVYKRLKWQYAMLKLRFSVSRSTSREGEISAVETRPALDTHTQSVDIIVCVHNALDDVVRCLESIQAHTSQPYHLILVDDGSGLETAAFLSRYAAEHQADLLRSDQATGYTYAANRGLRISTAEFVVLLNSDTIVTDAWLDRMVSCALSNPAIGIVGPLSNTASWQSIPRIEENGDWAENPLPEDISIETMGKLVAENSARHYLKMPFLNGFCLLMKRQVIQKVGLFDEEIFGVGYGEEDDLSLRARAAGWQLALADDVYIYHAQSKSYSTERRKALSQRAMKALLKKHGEAIIQEGVDFCSHNRVLEGIRARAAQTMDRYTTVRQGMRYEGKKVLFLVPITSPGGGMNVIRAESLAMQKMGVQVTFFNLIENRELFSQAYPEVEIPTLYGMIEDIPLIASQYDAVIATYNPTVGWLCGVDQEEGKPVLGYYVQDFEPLMYPANSEDYQRALNSYSLLPGLVLFTKTEWTRKVVYENTGQECQVIGVSINTDLYCPRPREGGEWPRRPLRIAAMIRPASSYREPGKTMQLLKQAFVEFGGQVEIWLFGTKLNNPDFLTLPVNFPWKLFGVLPQEKVANLLNQVDIFVDYSSHQAMGLTALEAMSCGCAVIVPENGGATSFVRNEVNGLVVDTSDSEQVWRGLKRLIKDHSLRENIQRNAIYDVCSYFPERAAANILGALFKDL